MSKWKANRANLNHVTQGVSNKAKEEYGSERERERERGKKSKQILKQRKDFQGERYTRLDSFSASLFFLVKEFYLNLLK